MTAPLSVLVDTSVWIDHFRHGNADLEALLYRDGVLMHPFVLLELACGALPQRSRTLADLGRLRPAQQATAEELLTFIEQAALSAQGCGMTDVALLASVRLTPGTRLWTLDRRLGALAQRLNVMWLPEPG